MKRLFAPQAEVGEPISAGWLPLFFYGSWLLCYRQHSIPFENFLPVLGRSPVDALKFAFVRPYMVRLSHVSDIAFTDPAVDHLSHLPSVPSIGENAAS